MTRVNSRWITHHATPRHVQEPYLHHFTPGVHYEAVRYDLSDVAERTRLLIKEAQRDPSRLERMAAAAMERGVEVFHFLAQADCMAWAMMRAKEASPWEVQPPDAAGDSGNGTEKGWHVLKMPHGRRLDNPYFRLFEDSVRSVLAANFEVVNG
jgi:hypothetical protein